MTEDRSAPRGWRRRQVLKGMMVASAGVAAAGNGLWPATARAADDDSAQLDALYADAKSENGLLIYSSTPESYVGKLADTFNKRFPDINMQTFSATASPLLERYMADAGRNAVQADLMQSSISAMQRLIEGKLLADYTPTTAATIPDSMKTLVPYAWPDRIIEHVVVYNSDLVSPDEAKVLTTWDGVVDPRWKGQLAIADPNLVGGWYNGFYMLYKIKGPDWFDKLAALNPRIYNSNIPAVESVVSGQNAVALTIDSFASSYFQRGAPLRTTWPEPTPEWTGFIGVSEAAPHPKSARLFLEWFFSAEGMDAWAEIYQVTVPRPGIPDRRAFAKADWFTGAKSAYVLKPADLAKEGKTALAAWNKAFGK